MVSVCYLECVPFEYHGWSLYIRDVKLKRGPKVTIYFFSKKKPRMGTPSELPEGLRVVVNKRTGLPFLVRRKRPTVSEEARHHILEAEDEVLGDLDE